MWSGHCHAATPDLVGVRWGWVGVSEEEEEGNRQEYHTQFTAWTKKTWHDVVFMLQTGEAFTDTLYCKSETKVLRVFSCPAEVSYRAQRRTVSNLRTEM